MSSTGARSKVRLVPGLILAAVAAGCAANGASGLQGSGSGGSGVGDCQSTICLPTIFNAMTLAAEVNPPAKSDATLTEIPSLVVGVGSPINLTTDTPSSVAVTFVAASGGTVPANANILLDVPSQIPGRPDLAYQQTAIPGAAPTGSGSAATAQVVVPQKLLTNGSTGKLSLLPFAPDDQQTPPYSFVVALTSAGLPVETLPSDNLPVSGTLNNSVLKPPTVTFVARAFQRGTLVSNAPPVTSNGDFQLVIPAAVATVGSPVTIQLTPQSQFDPWFIFTPFQLSGSSGPAISLGTVKLGAYTPVSQFNVLVQGTDGSRVSGAVVQAQTNLGGGSTSSSPTYNGTTSFAQSGMTDTNGTVVLSLIPANGGYSGAYDLVAVPPAASPWATTCSDPNMPPKAVGSGNVTSAGGQPLTTLKLDPRPWLTGTVTDANGRGVAGMAITATPGGDPTGNCTSTPAAPGSTTTDYLGSFTLPLDPGTYQLDYDPALGSAAPRLTESGVQVAGTSTVRHDVRLPRAGLVLGTVVSASGDRLPNATVKLFQPQCSSSPCPTPPLLRGQAVTDSTGYFQIVVAVAQ
jgi:hypothetical protein